MNASQDGQTPGQRIDKVLAPYLEDEARLEGRLDKLKNRLKEVHVEIEQAEQDLSVVRSAKVDALRDVVEKDPMLAVLFKDGEPKAATGDDEQAEDSSDDAEPEPAIEVEQQSGDRHRLLAQ